MFLYLLKELACCVLLAAALVLLIGAGVLVWKAARSLAGGIQYARVRLARGRLSEVFVPGRRQATLTLVPVLQAARVAAVDSVLASKTA
jgi:hypothetical protein